MDEYLIFQLYAPLASWGGQAVGQERPSDDNPSRSALLGLIAAALGIRRDDEDNHQALSNACRFGVKLLAPGLVLRDFHTIQVPPSTKKQKHLFTRRDELQEPKIGTMLSYRSYRQDAFCIVAVTIDSETFSPVRLQKALLEPVFPLYLGRKSCPPALPLNPQLIQSANLREALDAYVVYGMSPQLDHKKPRYYWEAKMNAGMDHNYRSTRYDQPINRKRWQFAPRDEFVCLGEE